MDFLKEKIIYTSKYFRNEFFLPHYKISFGKDEKCRL
jgi:hypothetical protein